MLNRSSCTIMFALLSPSLAAMEGARAAQRAERFDDGQIQEDEAAECTFLSLPLEREPTESNQDLGISVKPDFKDMQLWASSVASRHLCQHLAPPPAPVRSRETRHTQRAVDLRTPMGGRQDAVVSAYKYQPRWRPKNESVLRALSPGAPPLLQAEAASTSALPWPSLASEPLTYCSSLDRPFAGRGLRGLRPEEGGTGREAATYFGDYCRPPHGGTNLRSPRACAFGDRVTSRARAAGPRRTGSGGGGSSSRKAALASRRRSRRRCAAYERHPLLYLFFYPRQLRSCCCCCCCCCPPSARQMAAQAQLQRPKSASVLRFYGIDHYGGREGGVLQPEGRPRFQRGAAANAMEQSRPSDGVGGVCGTSVGACGGRRIPRDEEARRVVNAERVYRARKIRDPTIPLPSPVP